MEIIEHIDEKGRKYKAYSNGNGTDGMIVIGPPEGLVDSIGLPEELATRLHNILYSRNLINLDEIKRHPNALLGAWQEALGVDAQRLQEAFFKYEKPQEVPQ